MFNFCFGIYAESSGTFWELLLELKSKPGVWSEYGIIKEFFASIVIAILYFILIFIIEKWKSTVHKESHDEALLHKEKQEEEVLKEIEEVKNNNDYSIKVENMSKVYTMIANNSNQKCCSLKRKDIIQKKVAVKGVSFGVRKGDCFGLLGTNGAGKTTTFKILSGEIQPTAGQCLINGMSTATEM